MSRKPVLAIIVLFVAATLFGLLGHGAKKGAAVSYAAEPVTITFYHAMAWYDKGGTLQIQPALQTLVDKFNAENPDIRVIATPITSKTKQGSPYNALYREILVSCAKDTPPDVAQVYENWTTQLMEIKKIVPMESFIWGPEGLQPSEVDDFVPIFREANTYKGKIWTLPFNKSIYVLYYNRNMFRSAGITTPPATWTDLKMIARKLTRENETYGLLLEPSVDMFGHYLYAFGGDFFKSGKAAFNDEIGLQDVQYWVEMVHNDKSALLTFRSIDEFMKQKGAMMIYTTSRIWQMEQQKKKDSSFDYGIAILPVGRKRCYQFAGTNLAIFETKNKARKEAAWKFVKFLCSKESTIYWSCNTGYLPVRTSAINSEEYRNYISAHPDYQVGVEAVKYAKIQPKVTAWESVRGILDDAMYNALSQRETPRQALDDAAKKANMLLINDIVDNH